MPSPDMLPVSLLHRRGYALELAEAIVAGLEADGYVIVNKDDLRMLIEGQKREKVPCPGPRPPGDAA